MFQFTVCFKGFFFFPSPSNVDSYSSTDGSIDTDFILHEGMPERVCSLFTSSRIDVSYALPYKPPFVGQRCNFVSVMLTCIRAQIILLLKTIFCLKKCMKGFALCLIHPIMMFPILFLLSIHSLDKDAILRGFC